MGQVILFVGVVLSVVALIHYYLWRKLVRATTLSGRGRRVGTWVIVGLALLVVAAFGAGRVLPPALSTALSWPAYLWLAVMFYLLVAFGVLEVPLLVVRRVLRRRIQRVESVGAPKLTGTATPAESDDSGPTALSSTALSSTALSSTALSSTAQSSTAQSPTDDDPPAAVDQSRRLFLARAVAVTVGLASTGVVGAGVRTALGPPLLKRVRIPLAKVPRGLDGFRIALVSDIHLGPLLGIGHTRRIVDAINGMNADVVAVVGDLVDGSVEELGAAAAPLRDLRSRHGAFFVTGNHEYFSGYEMWNEEVARLGLRPLRNERVELPGGLYVAGVNDVTGASYGDGPDFAQALGDRDPARPVVVLAHQPVQAHTAARYGADLQLSGHTHGGQIVPFNAIVKLAQQPVVSGLGEVDGMPVYVTNGAGFWGPPVRVGAPPDITLVELRAPS